MAQDKNNFDDWGDDYDTQAERDAAQAKLLPGETERDVEIRKFISGGKSRGGN